MRTSIWRLCLMLLGIALTLGCKVTEEKIELWKGTKNGPKKLASTAIDTTAPMPLRAKALIALTEIQDRDDEDVWELYTKTFGKIQKADAEKLLDLAVPILAKKVEGGPKGAISKAQVGAKDSLYIMLDYAGGKGKIEAEKALIKWCTTDYNIRALAGKYNIRAIVKKIGPPAAEALIQLLNFNEIAIKFVAELIRDVNDETVLAKASAKLAGEYSKNVNKLQEIHLITAAIIGRDSIGKMLLGFAANKDLTPELQRFSLRAYSEGLTRKTITISDEHIASLFTIAENTKLDQYQREETYYVIAQAGREKDAERVHKLLKSSDSFWRSVGVRCLLRMDEAGEKLDKLLLELDQLKLSKNSDDVSDTITRIAAFPKMLPKVRELLKHQSAFVAAVSAGVLGEIGTTEDSQSLETLLKNDRDLPKGFKHRNLSDAAKAAIERIKERG